MPTSTNESNNVNQRTDDPIDPINSKLSGLVDDLDNALADTLDRPDSRQIIRGLTAAVLVQEMTRMTVTKAKMDAGTQRSIDAERLHSDWQALCRHYAGSKHATVLDNGVTQIEKLSPEEAQKVIHAIRDTIEPTLNWAMEEEVVTIGLNLPLVGKIGIGKLNFNLRGTRVAMQTLRGRLIRSVVQGVLWLAVMIGATHWISWTFFDEPYLASEFVSIAKLTQFILLLSTTFVVWTLTRNPGDNSAARYGRLLGSIRRMAVWVIVAAGWCHLLVWLLFDTPSEVAGLEVAAKLLLPFFLASASIAAWVSGRIFRTDGKDDE